MAVIDFWCDSHGTKYPVRTDFHKFCPKGHQLMSRVAPVTEVPAFCNFCFKHIVQSAWAGDVKFCHSCHFTICAACLIYLQNNSEKLTSTTCSGAVSSLNVRLSALFGTHFLILPSLIAVFRVSIFHGFVGLKCDGKIIIVLGLLRRWSICCFDQGLLFPAEYFVKNLHSMATCNILRVLQTGMFAILGNLHFLG